MTKGRFILAAVLLVFAWKGSDLSLYWPPAPHASIQTPQPGPELMQWGKPLKAVLPRMLPDDRKYLASFYDAMAFVLIRDGERESPIIGSTEQFAHFHAGSLRLAIDKANVGKYQGLAEAVDETFVNACGSDIKPVDKDTRARLVSACGVLAYSFGIHRDE